MTARAWLLAASCLALLAAGGCSLTRPEDDPVQIKLRDLETRLEKIERILSNQSLLDLSNQVEGLQSDMRSMHNDIDELNHAIETTRKQQHDLYADLDARLKSMELRGPAGGTAAATAPGGGSGADASSDSAEKASYQAAFDLLKNGQYDRAVAGFRSYLSTYPNGQLSDNALYWLGEAYYVDKSYAEALASFQHVVDNFPASRKLPDALLKIGYCDYELKDYPGARAALSRVTSKFPDAPAAHLAQQRLDSMGAEQH
jgi:tol-pal system protein YbgF